MKDRRRKSDVIKLEDDTNSAKEDSIGGYLVEGNPEVSQNFL